MPERTTPDRVTYWAEEITDLKIGFFLGGKRPLMEGGEAADHSTSLLKFEEDNSLPRVSQPARMLWSSPKSSSLRRPKEKCSTIRYRSSGFVVEPVGGHIDRK